MSIPKTFAIGAVSRLLGISTHALRKWEMRYGAISPSRSEGGDRRYSEDDVERLTRLSALVGQGHAIGTIATLSNDSLDDLLGSGKPIAPAADEPLQAFVVGRRLWAELETSTDRLQHTTWVGHVDDVAQLQKTNADAIIAEIPKLGADTRAEVQEIRERTGVDAVNVVYRYSSVERAENLSDARTAVTSRPLNMRELERTIRAICVDPERPRPSAGLPPHRFSRRVLAEVALISPAIACECPRHVAELVFALADFEVYSANCEDRNPADAVVHSYLKITAANARAAFEEALAVVAAHENIPIDDW